MSHDDRFRSRRRPLLQALGAGTTLSMLGGTAVAQQDDGGDEGTDHTTGTVHTVETLIRGPPTNPERPADFFYQPTGLHVQPGDVVKWVFTTPDHNVVTYHPAFGMRRRVPNGVDAVSSPVLGWRAESIADDQQDPPTEGEEPAPSPADGGEGGDGEEAGGEGGEEPVPETWLHAFETPGVYDLLCSPHENFGMAMRVVVGDVTETAFETSDPEALPEPRVGPVGLSRVTLTDPALDPSNIVSEGTVAWEDLEANQTEGAETTEEGTETEGTETEGTETEGTETEGTETEEEES